MGFLCSSIHPGAHSLDQAGLKLRPVYLYLLRRRPLVGLPIIVNLNYIFWIVCSFSFSVTEVFLSSITTDGMWVKSHWSGQYPPWHTPQRLRQEDCCWSYIIRPFLRKNQGLGVELSVGLACMWPFSWLTPSTTKGEKASWKSEKTTYIEWLWPSATGGSFDIFFGKNWNKNISSAV